MAKLTPNAFLQNKEYKVKYRELNKLELSSFLGGYVQWLLAKVEDEQLDLQELYIKCKDSIDDRFDVPERISINIAIALMGLTIFQTLAGELGLDVSIPFETIVNSQVRKLVGEEAKGSLAQLMQHTATMVASFESFCNGVDYQLDYQNGELILGTERWFAELWKFCREYMYHDDIITKQQMRNFLTENSELNSYVKVNYSAKRMLDNKQKRCTVIDVFKLEKELGIPVDAWI